MAHIKFFKETNLPLEMHKVRIVQKLHLLPIEERLQKINYTLRLVRKCLGKEVEDVFGITYTKKVK